VRRAPWGVTILCTIILQAFLCLLLFSNVVLAENIKLDPLTVVSTRLDDEVANAPKNITIITSEQIEASPAKTIPELLSLEAGILSRSFFGNSAARSTIDIRGFGASSTQNTLILLDGRRLNNIDQSSINYAAIPIHNIERIEIIRGSGGVLYGDGAVGGAINIITKRAQAGEKSGVAKVSYGSYKTSQAEAILTLGTEKYGINIAANYIDSNGYRSNNELKQENIQTDIRRDFDRGELFIKAGASEQHLGLSGNRQVNPGANVNLLVTDRQGASTPKDFAKEDSYFLTLGSRQQFYKGVEAIIDFGYRFKNQKAFFDQSGFPSSLDSDFDTWSVTPRLSIDQTLVNLNHHITFGADVYYYNYDSNRSPTLATSNNPIHKLGVDQKTYALYFNDLIDITNSTHFELGARIQHVNLNAVDKVNRAAPGAFGTETKATDKSQNNTEEMYNLGIRHEFTNNVSVYGNIGRSVRFANVDDVYDGFSKFTLLNPQTANHFDIGVSINLEKVSASVSSYYMDLENEIHFNAAASTFGTNVNLDPTKREGIETTIELMPFTDFSIRGNYAYLVSEFDEGALAGNEVPLIPKHTASISANWNVNSVVTIASIWRYVGEKRFDNDQNNNFGQKIPDYHMWDLKLNGHYHGWATDVSLNNVLDEKAIDYAVRSTTTAGKYNAQPLPERNITLSVSYNFN
jgi:iron complex outermembrane receptor protein